MALPERFPGYVARKLADGNVVAAVESIAFNDLPPGEVTIAVAYSSLNFKDALACQGHSGVVRSFPHVPGIDCAGTVVASDTPAYAVGDEVLVTGYELGAERWGGFAAFVRVPSEWVVRLPPGLTLRETMIYGTAGFTAAQCVDAIVSRGIGPDRGPVVVTGATGGVGCIAVAILARLGYDVTAVTGKQSQHGWLRQLGATSFLGRQDVDDASDRPLLAARFAAAVDTVGGRMLATIVRSLQHRGCVAACGLVAGVELPLTVYPFLLRGITLAGIDSARCPRRERLQMWENLATSWHIDHLDSIAEEVKLGDLSERVQQILAGEVRGRTLVVPRSPQLLAERK